MWLPTPVYESLPYMYVAVGILLIAGAGYIGLDSRETAVYIGCGSIAVLSGVFVYLRRSMSRTKRENAEEDSESATAE